MRGFPGDPERRKESTKEGRTLKTRRRHVLAGRRVATMLWGERAGEKIAQSGFLTIT